jgi:hypothetical protein
MALERLAESDSYVHCPKRLINFVTDNCGRWAQAINNEHFRYWKQAPYALVFSNELLRILWDNVADNALDLGSWLCLLEAALWKHRKV